jgi:hypothetical protein
MAGTGQPADFIGGDPVVPAIPLRRARCTLKRDARVIGERSDAVLRTAMPAHDNGEIPFMENALGKPQ